MLRIPSLVTDVLLLSVLSLAGCPREASVQEVAKVIPTQVSAPAVLWGKPANGLMLGVEQPKEPFLFIPGEGWESLPRFTVHLRNVSSEYILWTDYPFAWHVSLFDQELRKLEPDHYPMPSPTANPPQRLHSGDETVISIPISVGATWKRVAISEGNCSVIITYSPDNYLNMDIGGNRIFDVPGFWTGSVKSAPAVVSVKHRT